MQNQDRFDNGDKREYTSDHHLINLFMTERIEDYVVLTLALVIVIIVLVFA